jgi:transposase
MKKFFARRAGGTVVLETGTHARWVAELLESLGHEVIVANAREVRLIYGGRRKNDQLDAEALARLGRFDPKLLNPVTLRSRCAHADRAIIRARAQLVELRTELINHVRGTCKASGARLPGGSADAFHRRNKLLLPKDLEPALAPIMATLEHLTTQIHAYDKQIADKIEQYDKVKPLLSVVGVGPITALSYVLTLEDPKRFARSRDVGPFLGLVPKERQSGGSDPELGITKAGDPYLRKLLVQCAHYILGPFGPDSDLRRFGERMIAKAGTTPKRGKKRTSPKKRAAVAVARKLAVLLHRLWVTGADWKPLYAQQALQTAA